MSQNDDQDNQKPTISTGKLLTTKPGDLVPEGPQKSFIERATASKEQRRAQQKAERIYYDSELSKLKQTLEHEVASHKTYYEQLTQEKCAKLVREFQGKIDQLHLAQQDAKMESCRLAIEKTDTEIKKIESSQLAEPMKAKLIERLMDNLNKTLDALG
ncbi:hypothetical protein OLMES_3897 [Oleiphilus messinensis]|uniref:Uncharacterized protein n=1 Tax=Oleiphilus messinensis TaxID=141451 RepID=A0A1Y0IBL9_9GAMM|nr:hypothetical protein [Oleiphilus messinensis]ARU57917.1 hypothetical protein OLMES_3897 [Oleiphilus messinensis]